MKRSIILMSLGTLLVISIGIGVSYSLWTSTLTQTDTNNVTAGCFSVTLSPANSSTAISLTNAYPITDAVGKTKSAYEFTITNTCSVKASYTVNLESLSTSTMSGDYIKVQWNDATTPKLYTGFTAGTKSVSTSKDSRVMQTGTLNAKGSTTGASVTYKVRMWITDTAPTTIANQKFDAKIVVSTSATS